MSQPTEQPLDVEWEIGQEGVARPHTVTAATWVRSIEFVEFSTADDVVVLVLRAASVQYIRRIG